MMVDHRITIQCYANLSFLSLNFLLLFFGSDIFLLTERVGAETTQKLPYLLPSCFNYRRFIITKGYKHIQSTSIIDNSLKRIRGGGGSEACNRNDETTVEGRGDTFRSRRQQQKQLKQQKQKKQQQQQNEKANYQQMHHLSKQRQWPCIKKQKSFQLYMKCIIIVFSWVITGTIFYSKFYTWPLSQSFFYAIDAGMSIGFCTEVTETEVASKAFTIIYILLGSSCVGGTLTLFIHDVLERIDEASTREYKLMLEQDAFRRADKGNTGYLSREEFRTLVQQWYTIVVAVDDDDDNCDDDKNDSDNCKSHVEDKIQPQKLQQLQEKWEKQQIPKQPQQQRNLNQNDNDKDDNDSGRRGDHEHFQSNMLTEAQFEKLWNKFDRSKTGVIRYKDFIGRYRGIHKLLNTSIGVYSNNGLIQTMAYIWEIFKSLWTIEYRIYTVFFLWVIMGIIWGNQIQKWDIITSIHFAVSALATGGLTAPDVSSETGVLSMGASLFCGMYCLLGIPLYYLMLGHFATVLVEGHITSREHSAISKSLTIEEYEFAKHLCTPNDSVVHLSYYIILQFLRQGKTTLTQLELIKKEFELLDTDHSGVLTLQQATAASIGSSRVSRSMITKEHEA